MIEITVLTWIGLFALSFFVALYATIVGGGALILIPVFTLAGIPLLPALANTRVVSAFLQIVSVIAFSRKKKINWKTSLWSCLWTFPSSILGAYIAVGLPDKTLQHIVALLMALALVIVLRLDLKSVQKRQRDTHFYLYLALGSFLLGLYGGIYGAAFSTLLMIFFIRFDGEDLITSSANASVVGAVMSSAASLAFIKNGLVSWEFVLPLVLGGVVGTFVAIEFASKKGSPWIKALLVAIISLSLIKLLF